MVSTVGTRAQSKTLKIKYQMFLTVPWGIFIFGKIARCMFCIFKSNYIVSYNSIQINREKLGDYLKWTDYSYISYIPSYKVLEQYDERFHRNKVNIKP